MIRPAEENEVQTLVEFSKKAFATDITVGGEGVSGPPMFDSLDWHFQIQKMGILYTIIEEDKMIGGMIIYPSEENPKIIEIGRIFLYPQYFQKGLGLKAMRDAEEMFSDAAGFQLDTPVWNRRTRRFYEKLGYHEAGRNQYLIFYKKMR